jgi:hypothetical protein
LVTPLYGGWSVDFWIKREDEMICPSRIEGTLYKRSLKITAEALMTEEDGRSFVVMFYRIVTSSESTMPSAPRP